MPSIKVTLLGDVLAALSPVEPIPSLATKRAYLDLRMGLRKLGLVTIDYLTV